MSLEIEKISEKKNLSIPEPEAHVTAERLYTATPEKFTGLSLSYLDVSGDISFAGRAAWSVADVATSVLAPPYHATNSVFSKGAPLCPVIGLASCLDALQGANVVAGALKKREVAQNSGDEKEITSQGLNCGRGVAQIIGSSSTTVDRILSVTCSTQSIAPSAGSSLLLGRVTYWSGFTNWIFSGAFFMSLATWLGHSIKEVHQFQKKLGCYTDSEKLKTSAGKAELINFLGERFSTTFGDNLEKLEDKIHKKYAGHLKRANFISEKSYKKAVKEAVRKGLYDNFVDAGVRSLKQQAKEFKSRGVDSSLNHLNKKQWRKAFETLFRESVIHSIRREDYASEEEYEKAVQSKVQEAFSLKSAEYARYQWKMKKDAKMQRLFGSHAAEVKQILNDMGVGKTLKGKVTESDLKGQDENIKKLCALMHKVSKQMRINKIEMIIVSIVAFLGAVAFGCALGLGAGMGLLADALVIALIATAFLCIDAYFLNKSLEADTVGAFDKHLVATSAVISIVVFAFSIVASLVLGIAPPITLIFGGVVTALSLILNGYMYHQIHKKAKKAEKANPTIEGSIKRLRSKESLEEIIKSLERAEFAQRMQGLFGVVSKGAVTAEETRELKKKYIAKLEELREEKRKEKNAELTLLSHRINKLISG